MICNETWILGGGAQVIVRVVIWDLGVNVRCLTGN